MALSQILRIQNEYFDFPHLTGNNPAALERVPCSIFGVVCFSMPTQRSLSQDRGIWVSLVDSDNSWQFGESGTWPRLCRSDLHGSSTHAHRTYHARKQRGCLLTVGEFPLLSMVVCA
jgi:hypothetical protein